MAKSKAVSVERVFVQKVKRSRSRRGGGARVKIPLAVVLGFVPTGAEMVRQAQAGWAFRDIVATPVYNFTGYSMTTGQWSARGLVNGWMPVIAGYAAHWLANMIGVNRLFAKMTHGMIGI